MTNRLEQIEARVKAATPGPWDKNHWWGGGDCDCGDWYDTDPPSTTHPHDPDTWHCHPEPCAQCERNEGLILHAAVDIPALLAVVRAVEKSNGFCCRLISMGLAVHSDDCPLAALLEEGAK